MIDETDVIEVEVVESSLDEEPHKQKKPQKVRSDKRKQILFWGTVTSYCFRFGFPVALVFGFALLAFAILYGETHAIFQLVMLIISASFCGLGIFASLFGFVSKALMVHYMKQDPNYENQVE